MQTEPVASGPRGKNVLRRNPCRGLTLATALAVSTLWMLATEARSQVQIDAPNPGDISGVTNLIAVHGHFGDVGTSYLTATHNVDVGGNVAVTGDLTVNGSTRFGNSPTDKHEFYGNTILGANSGLGPTTTQIGARNTDTLTVKATSTFDAPVTINGPLTTNGQATLGSLRVTGDTGLDGNLSVGGNLNMGGGDIMDVGTLGASTINAGTLDANSIDTGRLTASEATVSIGNITTLSTSTIVNSGNFTTGTLTTNGNATLGSLKVTGNAEFNGNLNMVGGDIMNVGTLGANSISTATFTANVGQVTTLNTSTIVNSGNITTDTLTTNGKATLGSLEVVNDAEVKGSLTVANGATVSKSFTVTPGSTVDMGGNRVENVGDPIALTDAANKGYVDAGLARAFRDIDRNTEGVALAMAMAGTPTLLPMENFALTANWGQFEGAHGLAAGFAVRLDQNLQLNGGIAYGPNENTVGTRAGVRIGW